MNDLTLDDSRYVNDLFNESFYIMMNKLNNISYTSLTLNLDPQLESVLTLWDCHKTP